MCHAHSRLEDGDIVHCHLLLLLLLLDHVRQKFGFFARKGKREQRYEYSYPYLVVMFWQSGVK